MNRKGFLLGEETIKIIIAIICLVALVYFLISLYMANKDKDLELAKASLEKLVNDANAGKTETEIYNPKGWGIVSFLSSQKEDLPEFCKNKGWNNCICICNFPGRSVKTFLTACNTKGVCQESDFSVIGKAQFIFEYEQDGIEITPPLFLSIKDKTITKKPTT